MTKNVSKAENYEHSRDFVRVGWSDSLNPAFHVTVLGAVHKAIGSSMGVICGGNERRINRGLGKLIGRFFHVVNQPNSIMRVEDNPSPGKGLFFPGAVDDSLTV